MPLARMGDFHHCPKTNSSDQSHVGGAISAGSPNVLIDGKPAARMGDPLICKHGPTDHIAQGNHTLLINGLPAAHLGFKTAHGGVIQQGSPTTSGGMHISAGPTPSEQFHPVKENTIEYQWQTTGDDDEQLLHEQDHTVQHATTEHYGEHIDVVEQASSTHRVVADSAVEKSQSVKTMLNEVVNQPEVIHE